MAKILIVDDRPTNRQYLLTLLGYGNHQLFEAANGSEALERVRAEKPDLVITDILMPTMSGYEFTQQLRADASLRSTTVIFYTATYSEPQAQSLAAACGVRIVLPKPCEPERVLAAVNTALAADIPIVIPSAARHRITSIAEEAVFSEDTVAGYLHELKHIRLGFEKFSGNEVGQSLASDFSKTLAELTLLTSRLSMLVRAGVELLSEREPERIAQLCFDAACGVVGSEYAAIRIFEADELGRGQVIAKGVDPAVFQSQTVGTVSLLERVLSEGQPLRCSAANSEGLEGLPAGHPPVRDFLGIPIIGSGVPYGWMYFANRLGAEAFTKEDQRIANTLALQLGLLLENFSLYDTLQKHAVALQLEVTERRRAESEILQLNDSLERRIAARTSELEILNEELESFSYSVSHDLRAPLNAIQGFAQLLQRDFTSEHSPPQQQQFLQHIVSASQRMRTLIDALLRLANVGWQQIEKRPVHLNALLDEVVAQLREENPDHSIEITLQACPDCVGDASLLKQVFVNLLSNSFKFTRHCARPAITVGWRKQKDIDAYFVRDNGVGFDMKNANRLFATFQRLHSASQFEGTGIGLSLVQRIVRRHGGQIWAEAAPDKGACFYFTLPPAG